VQSVAALHSTQRPRAALQTRERALHSRSEVHEMRLELSTPVSMDASRGGIGELEHPNSINNARETNPAAFRTIKRKTYT